MVFTAWTWFGLALMILGVVLVIIGIILYESNISNRQPQGWWVWFMLIGGVILTVIGAVLTVMLMRKPPA